MSFFDSEKLGKMWFKGCFSCPPATSPPHSPLATLPSVVLLVWPEISRSSRKKLWQSCSWLQFISLAFAKFPNSGILSSSPSSPSSLLGLRHCSCATRATIYLMMYFYYHRIYYVVCVCATLKLKRREDGTYVESFFRGLPANRRFIYVIFLLVFGINFL